MGGNLLADLVQEEVRRRERIVAIDDEAVLMAPYASRLPYQLMLAPRRPRARFEDDGPTGARAAARRARRLRAAARRLAAAEPVGAHGAARAPSSFCWRIDMMPRLTHLAGLELGTGVQPQHRRARAGRGRAARGL